MSAIYSKFADAAVRLIDKFGLTVNICRTVGETHNAVTGTDSGGYVRNGSLRCVVLNASDSKANGFDFEAEFETLDANKRRFVIASAKNASFEPQDGDEFGPFDSVMWKITGVTPVSPTGLPIVYKFGVVR